MPIKSIGNLNIICGHYGSGKTNFAVNLALHAKILYQLKSVHIADIDIVNPYFRTADAEEMLRGAGVDVLVPEFANTNVDIPSLPPRLIPMFESREDISIIDVGGDEGAVALGMYREMIKKAGYDMYYVINMYRPLIADPTDCYLCMKDIEEISGLKCTKIVNNSSLGAETTEDDIAASIEYAKKCAELCALPIAAHTYCDELAPRTPELMKKLGYGAEPLFAIKNATKKLF